MGVKIKAFLLLLCLWCLYACKEKIPVIKLNHNSLESFTKDIPKDDTLSYFKKKNSELIKSLGLNSLENGFNGLQIRIWRAAPFVEEKRLLILTQIDSNWKAELIMFTIHNQLAQHKQSFIRNPSSGWKSFLDNLVRLDIFTLPDCDTLSADYYKGNDADGVRVEFADNRSYRTYTYSCPDINEKKFIQAKKMMQIMRLIEDEFNFDGFTIPWKYQDWKYRNE